MKENKISHRQLIKKEDAIAYLRKHGRKSEIRKNCY